jgi:hypothetical protein
MGLSRACKLHSRMAGICITCVCTEPKSAADAAARARKAELKGGFIKGQWTKEVRNMHA